MVSRRSLDSDNIIRVLHVDDERDQLEFVKRFLEELDPALRVKSSPSPKEAQQLIQHETFDCIVSDYVFPGMDGLQLCSMVREQSQLPFILYTGKGSEEVAEKAFECGADDYIRKEMDPSHYQVLVKRIRMTVEKRRAEKLSVLVLNESLEGIAIIVGTKLVYANQAQADLLGVDSPEELRGRDITEWNMEGERIRERVLSRQRGESQPSRYEYTLRRKDGEIRRVEATVSLIDYMGKPASLAFNRDITERKKVEEIIAFLGRVIETSPISVIATDKSGKILYVNSATEKMFGYEKDELLGKEPRILNAEPDADRIQSEINDAVQRGEVWSGEILNRRKNGETFYIQAKVFKLVDEKGDFISLVGFQEDITERKKYEVALKEAEERYRTLVESSPNPVSVTIASKIVYVNQKRVELTGHSNKSELIETSGLDNVVPEDRDSIRRRIQAHERGEKVPSVQQLRLMRRDGKTIHVTDHVSEIQWHGQAAVLHNLQDITELREAANALRRSEERYRTFLEASRDSVVVIADERYVYVNRVGAELLGYDDPSEIIGKRTIDFIAPEDRERVSAILEGRKEGEEQPFRYELKLLRKDGTKVAVENHVSLIEYEGKPASLVFTRDITERKRAEEALRRSEEEAKHLLEFQNKILDSANVWINFRDKEGNITLWNRAAEVLSGYSSKEVVGHKKFWEWLYPDTDYREEILEISKNVLNGARIDNYETVITCKDGLLKTISWYSNNILDEKGKPAGGVAVGIDVTDRKESERKLLEYTDHLKDLVEERSQELLDAERMATAGRVAAMVGHDLRGPLQAIKNAIYLLRKRPDDQENALKMAERSVNKAFEMLEEFRLSTSDTPLNVVATGLSELIEAAVDEASIPDSIDVVLEIGEGLDEVSVDRSKMRRVLDNLVLNAVEAMPDGGTLTVEAEKDEDEIVIIVRDTGVGILGEEMPNLFKAFYTTKPKGTGLGLVYCKRAVEAHGGTITAESQTGIGTTFIIRIPYRHVISE